MWRAGKWCPDLNIKYIGFIHITTENVGLFFIAQPRHKGWLTLFTTTFRVTTILEYRSVYTTPASACCVSLAVEIQAERDGVSSGWLEILINRLQTKNGCHTSGAAEMTGMG